MQPPNDEAQLCGYCEKRPAVKDYSRAGHTALVCATCFDRLTVQDALEDRLLHIVALERSKQYDEALACLDTILESNRQRDHDGWLARSVAHHRASILFDAGRYADAKQAHDEWAQVGFIDVWRRQLHALGMAKTLEALGRDREAVAVLENVLGYESPRDLPLALTVLAELVRLSGKLALPIDPKWRRVAEGAARCYGVAMLASGSLGQDILALDEARSGMQPQWPDESDEEEETPSDE